MSVLPYDKPSQPVDFSPLRGKPAPLLTPLAYAYKQDGQWDWCCPLGFTPPEPVYSWHYQTDRWLNALAEQELLDSHARPAALNDFLRHKAGEARAAHQAEQQNWLHTPAGIEQRLLQQPYFIRRHYQQRLSHLQQYAPAQQVMDYLTSRIKPVLLRVDAVRQQQQLTPYGELTARFHQRIIHLTELSRADVRLLGNDIAVRLEMTLNQFLTRWHDKHGDEVTGFPLLPLTRHLMRETLSLRVWPPGIDDDAGEDTLTGILSRLTDAQWWADRLWRLRRDDREALLRAANRVHAKAHPYLSREAFLDWREQRRRNRGFLQSHELEDEDGNTAPLFEQVLKSTANPALRRHELMARMEGVELVALRRGDIGMFYTLTCPSKYHSTHHDGRPNDKWQLLTIRDGQRYLCHLWGLIGAKLKRKGLRPYGMRVAEPHHDGTPHWHLLLFMPPEQEADITVIIRTYTERENKHEIPAGQPDARFKAKRIDPEIGSATAYIAKYISKNIDGYALDGEVCHESGRPLQDTARFATAWASLHRIRQYQPLGLPPVTVWRELRKLNNQLTNKLKLRGCYRRGQPLLTVRWMDNLMAAADAGCFASYIDAQGGVLIPRKHYRIRIAYETAEKPNRYGETVQKVFGIWAPALGEKSRINTYPVKWKIVRKKPKPDAHHPFPGVPGTGLGLGVDVPGGPAAPWSSVNNSTAAQKTNKKTAAKLREKARKTRFEQICQQLETVKQGLGISIPAEFLARQLLSGGKVRLSDAEIVLDRGQMRLISPETERKKPPVRDDKLQNTQQNTALLQRVARLQIQSPPWQPF